MLQAQKGTLISKFHKTALSIRYKELSYFLGVFNRMSGISSMLAGFASTSMMLSVPRWENEWVVITFLIFSGSAFGMNLLVILIATLCCVWGPGKALRGDSSEHLNEAIDVLERLQQKAMRYFVAGLFSYFISAAMVTWLFLDTVGALLSTVLLSAFLFLLVRQSLVIRRAFITGTYTSGHMRGNPMR